MAVQLPPRSSAPGEAVSRPRMRAETPPPHYWRRWTGDADSPAPGGLAGIPADGPAAAVPAAVAASPQAGTAADAALPTVKTPTAGIPGADVDAAPAQAVVAPAPVRTPADPQVGDPAQATPEETPYRVLVVEDDRSQAVFAQSVLRGAGMEAELLTETDAVMETIERLRPDLVLMDQHMPGLDGKRLTEMIRERPEFQLLPIVFLSGDPDPELRYAALDCGADDCLNKPIRPRHLIAAVANRIRRVRRQMHRYVPAPAPEPQQHPETGLCTRGHLLHRLDQALARQNGGGLYLIEIGGALGLRERYGYAAFERLMTEAGRWLAQNAEPYPLARLNDNGFLVLAEGLEQAELHAYARRLRDCLSAHGFPAHGEESIKLRGTIGYVALAPGFADAAAALDAVERGGVQARLRPDGIAVQATPQERADADRLRLLEGELEPAYQPIVPVTGGEQVQYQVLLRLRQADGTLLSAAQVVPAAEAAGRIAELDRQVREHALDVLAHHTQAGRSLRLFVTQSSHTLMRDGYADELLRSLAARGLESGALVIDLRLADAVVHAASLNEVCRRLMTAGVQLCLSQYVPGAEPEALLAQLPLGYVRLAARFAGAHADPALRDALRLAVDQAHRFGLQVIGQQVEDAHAAATMWVGGIDFIQGNLVHEAGNQLDFDFRSAVL